MPASTGLEYLQIGNVRGSVLGVLICRVRFNICFTRISGRYWSGTFTYNKAAIVSDKEAANKPKWQRKSDMKFHSKSVTLPRVFS